MAWMRLGAYCHRPSSVAHPSSAEVRRAEFGTPAVTPVDLASAGLHARILESLLDRHELVDEDRSGGGYSCIIEEAERSSITSGNTSTGLAR